ncbi:MAG: hypothetical protein DHS80DRAFT_23828 [Piptocephalis tieghemiana]|nr:MAG: hypothetical protein DHS80DRAFT_23828 [Piptocephalis tieghemiana]
MLPHSSILLFLCLFSSLGGSTSLRQHINAPPQDLLTGEVAPLFLARDSQITLFKAYNGIQTCLFRDGQVNTSHNNGGALRICVANALDPLKDDKAIHFANFIKLVEIHIPSPDDKREFRPEAVNDRSRKLADVMKKYMYTLANSGEEILTIRYQPSEEISHLILRIKEKMLIWLKLAMMFLHRHGSESDADLAQEMEKSMEVLDSSNSFLPDVERYLQEHKIPQDKLIHRFSTLSWEHQHWLTIRGIRHTIISLHEIYYDVEKYRSTRTSKRFLTSIQAHSFTPLNRLHWTLRAAKDLSDEAKDGGLTTSQKITTAQDPSTILPDGLGRVIDKTSFKGSLRPSAGKMGRIQLNIWLAYLESLPSSTIKKSSGEERGLGELAKSMDMLSTASVNYWSFLIREKAGKKLNEEDASLKKMIYTKFCSSSFDWKALLQKMSHEGCRKPVKNLEIWFQKEVCGHKYPWIRHFMLYLRRIMPSIRIKASLKASKRYQNRWSYLMNTYLRSQWPEASFPQRSSSLSLPSPPPIILHLAHLYNKDLQQLEIKMVRGILDSTASRSSWPVDHLPFASIQGKVKDKRLNGKDTEVHMLSWDTVKFQSGKELLEQPWTHSVEMMDMDLYALAVYIHNNLSRMPYSLLQDCSTLSQDSPYYFFVQKEIGIDNRHSKAWTRSMKQYLKHEMMAPHHISRDSVFGWSNLWMKTYSQAEDDKDILMNPSPLSHSLANSKVLARWVIALLRLGRISWEMTDRALSNVQDWKKRFRDPFKASKPLPPTSRPSKHGQDGASVSLS